MKREDPNFVPPTSVHARDTISRLGALDAKRPREDRMDDDDDREAKREKNDDDDGEEMEIEDDEDAGPKPSPSLYPP